MINRDIITGTVWEERNVEILRAAGVENIIWTPRSHEPGKDIDSDLASFSNKTILDNTRGRAVRMSSYRLGKVIGVDDLNNSVRIAEAINEKKNFEYYSLLYKTLHSGETVVRYEWYVLPADLAIFDPSLHTWVPKPKRKGEGVSGAITDVINGSLMEITLGTSTQLWMTFPLTDFLKSFLIAAQDVAIAPAFTYISLFDRFGTQQGRREQAINPVNDDEQSDNGRDEDQ